MILESSNSDRDFDELRSLGNEHRIPALQWVGSIRIRMLPTHLPRCLR